MVTNKELQLIKDKVIESTRLKHLNWYMNGEDLYRASFPRSSITISKTVFRSGIEAFTFRVLNANADEIGLLAARIDQAENLELVDLYSLVERQALAVDETVSDILGHLESLSDIPF